MSSIMGANSIRISVTILACGRSSACESATRAESTSGGRLIVIRRCLVVIGASFGDVRCIIMGTTGTGGQGVFFLFGYQNETDVQCYLPCTWGPPGSRRSCGRSRIPPRPPGLRPPPFGGYVPFLSTVLCFQTGQIPFYKVRKVGVFTSNTSHAEKSPAKGASSSSGGAVGPWRCGWHWEPRERL